jgi:hypothetical protein
MKYRRDFWAHFWLVTMTLPRILAAAAAAAKRRA